MKLGLKIISALSICLMNTTTALAASETVVAQIPSKSINELVKTANTEQLPTNVEVKQNITVPSKNINEQTTNATKENISVNTNAAQDKNIAAKSLKSVILNWHDIPGAVMYELVIKDADSQKTVFTKYDIYASGYQLNSNQVDLAKNLIWQVRGLNINKAPISDFTDLKVVHIGKNFGANWQTKGDNYQNEVFSKHTYETYMIGSDVKVAPLRLTTHFDEMAYMPVYPVYSWVPVTGANYYNIDVFFIGDNFNNMQKIASYKVNKGFDYYDTKAYTKAGLYCFNVQAYNINGAKLAESVNSYFTVNNKDVKIAALGDSITHGGGAVSTPPSSTLYDWETYVGYPVLNIGFSGNLTSDMLNRFNQDVLPFKPKVLFIMGGVNDIRTGIGADTVIGNLNAIKLKCLDNNIVPVFLTVTPVNPVKMKAVIDLDVSDGWQEHRQKINEWVIKQPYHIDIASALTNKQGLLADDLTTDGLHPDYQGKKSIGEAVGDFIRLNFSYLFY